MDTTSFREIHYLERNMPMTKTEEGYALLFIKGTLKFSSSAFDRKEDDYPQVGLTAAT